MKETSYNKKEHLILPCWVLPKIGFAPNSVVAELGVFLYCNNKYYHKEQENNE
ncbi:MAG: hypothetical protein IJZ46_02270 [Bacilli bacterium]|nr:hypothetical protein [Bacilli bacterium]